MAACLVHRGPDEDGFLLRPRLGLASRRLSIVGLRNGRQPISNEDQSVWVVFNGELFDYPEVRTRLEAKGHRFATDCDTELIPHLWEDHGEEMFQYLRGQFALALWDERRQILILARDRFGICPLFWTRVPADKGGPLLFASEIKALFASGFVTPRPDPRGLNQLLTFFATPGPVTCFEGVHTLLPGRYLRLHLPTSGKTTIQEKTYWDLDFPDRGQEIDGRDPALFVDRLEQTLLDATARRLRADVPVVSYLSGGVDSSLLVALAAKVLGRPVRTYSVAVRQAILDESAFADVVARHVGAEPVVVDFDPDSLMRHYPRLIHIAEAPVIDTSCAATVLLAEQVHADGFKVALTGEGADEWLAGYPWYRAHQAVRWVDRLGLGIPLRRFGATCWMGGSSEAVWSMQASAASAGGFNAWHDIHLITTVAKQRFLSQDMLAQLNDHDPYADLQLPVERMKRWHPFNRSLYCGAKILMPGMLLSAKGDRAAMNSSVETRYPFLDEEVCDALAPIHPRWKMRGLQEKYLLRLVAERWLPKEIAWRRKQMFRAPMDSFHAASRPAYIDQLLSEEALRRTGYFDPREVARSRKVVWKMRPRSVPRVVVELGLMGVLGVQLWHATFIDPSLADLSSTTPLSILAEQRGLRLRAG
jgi:asparagine synthase (glutamine-hydrolysing)